MSELKDPRVLFAAERTLLAWNRTSIALIAFGFVIARSGILIKIISGYNSESKSIEITVFVGVLFILVGAVVALYSAKQYSNVLKTLNSAELPVGYSTKWGIVVNVIVAFLGLALLLSIFLAH